MMPPFWRHIFLSIKLGSPAIWDFLMIWYIYIYIWVSFLVQKITKHFPKWRYSPNIKLYGYGLWKEKPTEAILTCNVWYLSFSSQTPVGVVLPYHFPSGRSPTLDSIIKASPSPWAKRWARGLKSSTFGAGLCQWYESDARYTKY